MYTISNTTKSHMERVVGLSMDKIKSLSFQEEQQWVELAYK